jgi:LacI family transcriptional regulator
MGVDVPGHISVTGYDNIFGADLVTPSLTTLGSDMVEGGRVAAMILHSQLDSVTATSPDRVRVVMPTQMILRASAGSSSVE